MSASQEAGIGIQNPEERPRCCDIVDEHPNSHPDSQAKQPNPEPDFEGVFPS